MMPSTEIQVIFVDVLVELALHVGTVCVYLLHLDGPLVIVMLIYDWHYEVFLVVLDN